MDKVNKQPDAGVSEAVVERACGGFWSHMKLIGCSKGFHEGASVSWTDEPEGDEKQELRDCMRAALANSPTDSVTERATGEDG